MPKPPRKKSASKKTAAAKTVVRISPSRIAAFHILLELSRSLSTHSDDLLQGARVDKLSLQDRNLCMTLTMGVLRWQLVLDQQITEALTHKTKLDEPVRVALRMGAFQLLFLDRIPAHAAISDSVELTKRAGHTFASGLVNAVLRKFVARADAIKPLIEPTDAYPQWMVERWTAFFGKEETANVCRYGQYPPPASVRVTSSTAEAALIEEGVESAEGALLRDARTVLSGDVPNSEALRDGVVRLQDEGSQLVAELNGGTPLVPRSILDACAAPGGKTAILAERYPQSRIIAADVSAARVAKMRDIFEKTPLLARIEARVLDASTLDQDTEQFDLLLCDVPCSGTGTLARNPEIKLRLTLDDLHRHQVRQISILAAGLRVLAPGGRLVYSTCSLEPEENEQVVQAALADARGIVLLPMRQRLEELRVSGILRDGSADRLMSRGLSGDFLRLLPGDFGTDGFFAAILTRV